MHRSDVVIVGGGPAGSTCARKLSGAGLRVILLDQARFPRTKPCAGWITPAVLKLLDIPAGEYGREHTLQPITAFRVFCGDGAGVRVPFGRVVSYGVRRIEFDNYLLRLCGARVFEQTHVCRIERNRRDWLVNGEFSAPLLIGAGGHFCPVARMLGAFVAAEGAILAQQAEWPRVASVEPGEVELLFFPDRQGYAWRLQNERYANVGFGRFGPPPVEAHKQVCLDWLRTRGSVAPQSPGWHGHAYLTAETSQRSTTGEGVLLVGDAAGLADPRSGEGIRPAIESAILAAHCVLAAAEDYSRVRLSAHSEMLHCRYSRRHVDWPLPELLVRRFMKLPVFVREVVVKRWFLHMDEPRLLRTA